MGLTQPDGKGGAKNEVAAATKNGSAEQPSQNAGLTAGAAMRVPGDLSAEAVDETHRHQDEAAKAFAATQEE